MTFSESRLVIHQSLHSSLTFIILESYRTEESSPKSLVRRLTQSQPASDQRKLPETVKRRDKSHTSHGESRCGNGSSTVKAKDGDSLGMMELKFNIQDRELFSPPPISVSTLAKFVSTFNPLTGVRNGTIFQNLIIYK